MTNFCKIGVDGGGTKTELILVDATGAIVATHTAPGCNPSQGGPEKARETLLAGLEALLSQSKIENPKSKIAATHLYMAGSTATWKEIAAGLKDFGSITVAADSLPVLELATAGAPGLVLHAGTGSFVAARAPDGSIHYAGGLGWKLGDAGSGFDLGRRGIAHALLELQGWTDWSRSDLAAVSSPSAARSPQLQKLSPLAEALCAHTGLADYAANSRFLYNDPAANAAIAGFAPRVLDLAAQGCAPAQTHLTEAVSELVGLARLVTTKLFGPTVVPCGVSGPILTREPAGFALKALAATHRWPVELHFITAPPIEGVRRLLGKG